MSDSVPAPPRGSGLRPGWSDLPAGLRRAVADRLGAPVRSADTATGGFTRGFAGVLTTADGRRVFLKAADQARDPHLGTWQTREAALLARLPGDLPVPRLRWTLAAEGWQALCLAAVPGRNPRSPWVAAELTAALAGYARIAAALAGPPPELAGLGLPHLADLAREDILWWGEVAAGREPAPPLPPAALDRLDELVALESRLPGYAAGSPGVIHGDLRADNLLVTPEGGVWFCDWAWSCHGPPWFDLVTLLLSGVSPGGLPGGSVGGNPGACPGGLPGGGSVGGLSGARGGLTPSAGVDVDGLFAGHPATVGAPPDALEVTLAALAGYFLTGAAALPAEAPPRLRAHKRRSGEVALGWLARRRGWPLGGGGG